MPIRIMRVVESLGVGGGVETGIASLMERMDRNRFEHILCPVFRLGPWVDRFRVVQVVPLEQKTRKLAVQVGPLARVIRGIKLDIVHSRNWGALEAVIAGRWGRSCRVIHSEHGVEADPAAEPRRRNWFRRVAFEMADRVFSVSYQLRDTLARCTGHLSVIEVDQQGIIDGPHKILERPYHLSYPSIFHWNGDLYMVPETSKARTVELYRCTSFPDKWELENVLLKDLHAVDATLVEIEGEWWMFVSVEAEGTNFLYELHLYHADSPLGPWQPHSSNPVRPDAQSSRPAGRIISRNGCYYRPAQEGPGDGRSIQKIDRLDREASPGNGSLQDRTLLGKESHRHSYFEQLRRIDRD